MPIPRSTIALALSLLLLAPALHAASSTAAFHERRIDRLIATPTPAGPILLGSDEVRYRLDVPAHATVLVRADGTNTSFFHASFHRVGTATPDITFPTRHATFELPGPASWLVRIDPAGGGAFHARITFEGFVADVGGAPATFTLTDAGDDRACVVPGVCLP